MGRLHKFRCASAGMGAVHLLALACYAEDLLPPPRVLHPAPPGPPAVVSKAAGGTITLGTPWTVVEALLGMPDFSSVIPCLHRSKLIYSDGMEVILVNARVVSVAPGLAAVGDLSHGYALNCKGCVVFIEPVVLRHPVAPEFDMEMKCHAEQLYPIAPPAPVGYPAPPYPPMRPDPHEEYHLNDPTPWRKTHVY